MHSRSSSESSGLIKLPNYGTVGFGTHSTRVSDTCSVTVNGGQLKALREFSNAVKLTMVNEKSAATMARPSVLLRDEELHSYMGKMQARRRESKKNLRLLL